MSHQAAPLDPSEIELVARELDRSCPLPAEAYVSESVFAWEQRHFFEASWVCIGRGADLPNPGDQKALRVGKEGIVLVRGEDSILRGFYNSCRHRGHELLPCGAEPMSSKVMKCPYHEWVYGLDGSHRAAPRFAPAGGFDHAKYSLIQARIAEWHEWVFVNVSGEAPQLCDYIGNLEELVAPYRPELLAEKARREYVVKANWKTITENYHECYHCPNVHPEFCRVMLTESTQAYEPTGAWVGSDMILKDFAETLSPTGESKGSPIPGLSDNQRRLVLYIGLIPNLLISLHPDYVLTHRMNPLSASETLVECSWLFPPDAEKRPGFDPSYAEEVWDITNRQDWQVCESVARGLASRGYRPSPFSWNEEEELHQFIAKIAEGYLAGGIVLGNESKPVGGPISNRSVTV